MTEQAIIAQDAIDRFVALLGPKGVITDVDDIAPWVSDWRGRYHGKARAILSPASTREVADCVALAAELGIALVPQGGNTSMVGGATPPADGSALILSLTLVPVLAYFGLKRAESHHEPWLMRQLTPRYARLLDASFAHKPRVFIGAGVALLLAGGAYAVTGKTFLPTMDEGSIIVQLTKLPSIGIEHSTAGDMKVQKALHLQLQ